jgi:hypothetical protein
MADDKFTQFSRMGGSVNPPSPPIPKVPEEIKARHPENRKHWEAYDAAWEKFFKETFNIRS